MTGSASHRLGDAARSRLAVAHVRFTGRTARRADRDEGKIGRGDALGVIAGEVEPTGGNVAGDQLFELRLVDRQMALTQGGNPILIDIDAGDVVSEIGETGAGYETDVARAYDSNFCQGKRPPGTWRPLVQQPSCRRQRSRFSTYSVWRWLYQPYSAPSNSLL